MNKPMRIAAWVLQGLLALIIGGPGVQKLLQPRWAEMFATWGYSDNIVYVIGVLEVIVGIGLLIRPAMGYAGLLAAAIMVGATTTHLMHDAGWGAVVGHLVLVVLFGVAAFIRRPLFLRNDG